MIPNVLSIAGSDPSGGAGIQADLKTFAALGAYGGAVITALTAQNTRGVAGVHTVPAAFVRRQLETVLDDVEIHAVKIGMLGDAEIAKTVAAVLERRRGPAIVLDPVMVAKGGDRLLSEDAVGTLRERLLPLATVVTPNLPEAGDLLGAALPATPDGMRAAARALHAMGPRLVLIKGGHLGGPRSPDLAYDGFDFTELDAPRVDTRNTHGTGCTLSSAIAALLPRAKSPLDAVRQAKEYVSRAIASAHLLNVGTGHGPVNHWAPERTSGSAQSKEAAWAR